MSTTTARRLALLGSTSLGLAAIVSAASLVMPTAALAQTATCVATTAVTNNGSDDVTIAGGANDPGITCAYTGTTATVTTLGAITVSSAAGGNGVNLTGGAADAITWISTAGGFQSVTGGANTNGPVIDAQTGGDITLTTGGVGVHAASGSDGIYARSTGGGNISLTTGSVGFGPIAGSAAIEAISAGGNINITTNGQVGTSAGQNTPGNLIINSTNRDGLVATTSGIGAISLDINSDVVAHGADSAAIRLTAGTGDILIDANAAISGGNRNNPASTQLASAIVVDSDGDIEIRSTSLIMGGIHGAAPLSPAIVASGDTFLLTLTGSETIAAGNFSNYRAALGGFINGQGFSNSSTGGYSSFMGLSTRHMGGRVDLSGVTGGAVMNFNTRSRWMLEGPSLMSSGDDAVNFDATSVLMTTFDLPSGASDLIGDVDQTLIQPGVIEFGAGADTFNNAGMLLIGPAYSQEAGVGTAPDLPPLPENRFGIRGEVRLMDLEQFNNSGAIWLGPMLFGNEGVTRTDGWHDDMLYMPGATFHGEEGASVVYMDVDLNKTQSTCAPAGRDGEGYLPAADCIGIQGGAATGRTELRLIELIPGDRGIYNPGGMVLVDLAGGDPSATDPDAFFISPQTPRYIDIGNGGIEKGVFAYVLGFDADTQQFKLYGFPSSGAQQFPILATAANQLWRTATGGWFDRRVHQRDVGLDTGLGTGAWFNVTGVGVQRDVVAVMPAGLEDIEFDNSYEQSDVTVSFGWDVLDYGSNAALGLMVGYAHSEVEFNDSDNSANLEGIHGGIYGGYALGGFFIDGAVNASAVVLDNDVPAMSLQPAGTMLDSEVRSLGGRVEAGWRWDTGYGLSVEPLVGFSAVATDFEDMRVPNDDPDADRAGVTVQLDSAESRRASAGLRVVMQDIWSSVAPTSFSLTARAVNEFEGGANVSVANLGPTLLSTDQLDGMFTQVTGSVGVSNVARTISGYLNVDTVTGDDYESLGASVGVRLHW